MIMYKKRRCKRCNKKFLNDRSTCFNYCPSCRSIIAAERWKSKRKPVMWDKPEWVMKAQYKGKKAKNVLSE